ncbi:hypothetical protein ACHAXA_006018 [Cyclostephanos tholiformis]|uniref:subtilisin n=1 Tax=Cyclostephanos tholiformis TaxID=382380 RepID=A0ABD3SRN8_9STRA
MTGRFRNDDGNAFAGGERSATPPRRMVKELLRPVFALTTISLLVYLLLLDGLPGFRPADYAARRELKIDYGGSGGGYGTIHPDEHVEVDEYGERFSGVHYANDDDRRSYSSSSSSWTMRHLTHVEGHVIVELEPNKDPDTACPLLAELVGGTVEYVIKGSAFNGCSIVPSEFHMQESGGSGSLPLEGETGVLAVEEDGLVEAYQANWAIWNLDRIDQCDLPLDGSFSMKEDATGVKVFVMDTGVRSDHEEFVGMIDPNDACHYSVVDSPMMPLFDGNGHGTHVAGTACGIKYGVASNCQLCSVKVLNSAGYGSYSGMIIALNHIVSYCESNPSVPCVINMSLGGSKSDMFNSAIASAVESGIVVVAAAGNSAKDACLSSPASSTSAITVGATTLTDAMSSFSNYGQCVDVYAPGTSILSASNTNAIMYSTKQGTSMASPHVAGIAAGILSANPGLTPAQVASVIVGSASPIGDMLLATVSSNYCGTPEPTKSPTPPPTMKPTKAPTPPPTPPPTSQPTPTCIHKNKYLGLTAQVCGGRRPLNDLCCSGRCYNRYPPNGIGKAFCR